MSNATSSNATSRPRPAAASPILPHERSAFLSHGFRPFFLGAGAFAAAAMLLWIGALAAGWPVGGDYGPSAWHAHEMLFGFGGATLAGFLLTAIPNWTGRPPLAGAPLAALAAVWLAGRLAMLGLGGATLAAAVDAAFLPLLALVCARELAAARHWGNMKLLAVIAALALVNLWFHVEALDGGTAGAAARAAVAAYALLIAIIGGRIVPNFTRNRLAAAGAARLPVPFGPGDGAAIAAGLGALAVWVAAPQGAPAVLAGLVGAAATFWRLSRWRGLATLREPLLFVLHVAFGFVGLGFLAVAAAGAGLLPGAAAMHVMMVGGIAGMMLAVMTRATRGHTGRALQASSATLLSYLCLFAAALARPAADLFGTPWLLDLAGGLWIAAFGLFLAEYAPMLLRRRAERG